MIYMTNYDTETLRCNGVSTDAGFSTLAEVESVMGAPESRARRLLTYPGGICFTDFVLSVDTSVNPVASCGNETGT